MEELLEPSSGASRNERRTAVPEGTPRGITYRGAWDSGCHDVANDEIRAPSDGARRALAHASRSLFAPPSTGFGAAYDEPPPVPHATAAEWRGRSVRTRSEFSGSGGPRPPATGDAPEAHRRRFRVVPPLCRATRSSTEGHDKNRPEKSCPSTASMRRAPERRVGEAKTRCVTDPVPRARPEKRTPSALVEAARWDHDGGETDERSVGRHGGNLERGPSGEEESGEAKATPADDGWRDDLPSLAEHGWYDDATSHAEDDPEVQRAILESLSGSRRCGSAVSGAACEPEIASELGRPCSKDELQAFRDRWDEQLRRKMARAAEFYPNPRLLWAWVWCRSPAGRGVPAELAVLIARRIGAFRVVTLPPSGILFRDHPSYHNAWNPDAEVVQLFHGHGAWRADKEHPTLQFALADAVHGDEPRVKRVRILHGCGAPKADSGRRPRVATWGHCELHYLRAADPATAIARVPGEHECCSGPERAPQDLWDPRWRLVARVPFPIRPAPWRSGIAISVPAEHAARRWWRITLDPRGAPDLVLSTVNVVGVWVPAGA